MFDAGVGAAVPSGELIDAGNIYASKSFYDSVGKRQVLFGWVHEKPGFPLAQRQGVQSIPRHVTLDPRNESRLLFNPIAEVSSLREPLTVRWLRGEAHCEPLTVRWL